MSHLVSVIDYSGSPDPIAAIHAARLERQRRMAAAAYTPPAPEPKPEPAAKDIKVRWSDDEVSILRNLHSQNKTCFYISRELDRSPNSVAGKAWSLGLSLRREPKKRPRPVVRDWLLIAKRTVEPGPANMADVLSVVCRQMRFSAQEMKGDGRHGPLVTARMIAYHLMKKHTEKSIAAIGRFMGGRDHTTVMNGVARIKDRMESDIGFANLIADISQTINETAGHRQ